MDPGTAALIAGGANAIGGIFSGGQSKKMNDRQIGLEELLGMRGMDIQSSAVGDQLRRQMESMPVRDRVLYQLNARMGQSPAQFNPSGLFGNAAQPASTGGVDFSALQKANAAYTPGAGGTRPDLASAMLGKLGYDSKTGKSTGLDWGNAYMQGKTGVVNTGYEKTLKPKTPKAPPPYVPPIFRKPLGQ